MKESTNLEFAVFKVRLNRYQGELFDSASPEKFVEKCVLSSLIDDENRKRRWIVADRQALKGGHYFRFGRESSQKLEVYRDSHFQDVLFERAPYTHVAFIPNFQVVAFARNARLGSFKSVASQFERLLNGSVIALNSDANIQVRVIPQPDKFLKKLQEADFVRSFTFTFKRPNPSDAEATYLQPAQKMLKRIGGDNGRTKVSGSNLNKNEMMDLTRSLASSGDEAEASVVRGKTKPQKISLREDTATLNAVEPIGNFEQESLIEKLAKLYRQIRRGENE